MFLFHLLFQWNKKSLRGEAEALGEVDDRKWRSPLACDGREEGLVPVWPCSMKVASPESRWLPEVPGNVGSYELGVPASPEILVPHGVQGRRPRL